MATVTKRLHHPYHLKRLYVFWRIRILRHPHSFKKVHHQHTSYPVLALLMLATGGVLVQSSLSAFALSDSKSITVSAIVSGPRPTVAPTIDSPDENAEFTTAPITVKGTCPVDSYVGLKRNSYPSGTSICSSTGTYSISTDLFSGANELVATAYNLLDEGGPDSTPLHVTYTPPVVTPPIQSSNNDTSSTPDKSTTTAPNSSGSSSTPSKTQTSPASPLLLRNDYKYQGFVVGQPASWQVSVLGGTAPYSISVAWGDGQTALYTSTTADTLTLSHTYNKSGPDSGGYAVIVTASDASNSQTTLQIFGLIAPAPNTTGTSAGGSTGSSTKSGFGGVFTSGELKNIGYLWSAFGFSGVTLLGFWLGEHHELRLLKTKFKTKKL